MTLCTFERGLVILMQQILLQVRDEQKAAMLRELLSSLDFVERVRTTDVTESDNGDGGDQTPFGLDRHPQRDRMNREVAAFESMHEALEESYLGQFVAIRQGKVIDADADEQALIVRVRERFPADVILFRKVQETLPPVLVFRSPRFADAR